MPRIQTQQSTKEHAKQGDRGARPPRVLVLATAYSYRLQPFLAAAAKLGVEVVRGLDVPPAHVGGGEGVLRLDFRDPARAARQARQFTREHPLDAVLPTDDATVMLAAYLGATLGLRHNDLAAAEAARDKHRMRQLLAQSGVRVPPFRRFAAGQAASEVARAVGADIGYPCVVKPTCLSGSRGVIRADDAAGLAAAFERVSALLARLGDGVVLVERYVPGEEYALEGLLSDGQLKVLALFDKPDPLEGPYFEETIYVTPSRAAPDVQAAVAACVGEAAQALGLREGAVHGEVRVNSTGAWLIEVAGRSIGGLCAQALRFAHGADVTLEALILRQALGWPLDDGERERQAGGVMMIPIPAAGVLRVVDGIDAARAVPGIDAVEITAKLNYPLVPLPEGESYLGFIFARAETPAEVEAALRRAHARLRFEVEPELAPVVSR
ncbi:MAG: ATP-grasp domain-containing protein [Anaerolineales bacterium]|nr:ATP-grasp domain-containing protein [Anaerolineales bacterium]